MIRAIQELVAAQINAMGLCDVVVGLVQSVQPLQILIEGNLILREPSLTLSAAVTAKTVDLSHVHGEEEEEQTPPEFPSLAAVPVRDGLRRGERVLLLKRAGGQHYYVLERLGG